MPGCGIDHDAIEKRRLQKSRDVRTRLIAKGLDPRGNGFMRAFSKAMRK